MSTYFSRSNLFVVTLFVIFSLVGWISGLGIGCIETQESSRDQVVPENVAHFVLVFFSLSLVIVAPLSFFLKDRFDNIQLSPFAGFGFGLSVYTLLSLIYEKQCLG